MNRAWPACLTTPLLLAACASTPRTSSDDNGAAAQYTAEGPRKPEEWPVFGGDAGGLKYSALTDINRENVGRLTVAWSWKTGEKIIARTDSTFAARPGQFQVTPIMIGDTLFFSTPYNSVVALDASSGRQLWRFDPRPYAIGQPSNGTGFVHRGVATWTDGRERRIFINSRTRLIALDASTGRPIPSFGTNGEIDLTAQLLWQVDKRHYTNTSPPVVYKNLIILGNGVGDRLVYKRDPPGDIQAFDVHTGKRAWVFHTIPQPGEFGHDTWGDSSWAKMGHTNVWAPFTVDIPRGLVYLPVSTPSNDWYGGERPGNNLFGESIVCLDANTGRRVWHYQIVHHGLWDYDPPAAPVLLTIRPRGTPIDAVALLTKQGFTFVFDRVTGAPVWPIEERPVPQSDVPGERSAATQPFPTKPATFAKQGFTEDDVIDFTPEVKRLALQEVRQYRLGPMYTPPSMGGTVTLPGAIGGAGWGGGAVDPETGILYVKASNSPQLMTIRKIDQWSDTVQATYTNQLGRQLSVRQGNGGPSLPVNKPPYGTLTAIDMHRGEHVWQVVVGDNADIRSHPLLKDATLPPLLGVSGSPGPMVTKAGLVFVTGGGPVLYAIDAANGRTLWQHDFGRIAYSVPMTYRTRGGKQFVVIATGAAENAELVAFAVP
jgi:quinoprotein glucose dehydrogenase